MNKEETRMKCANAIEAINQLIGVLQEDVENNADEITKLQDIVNSITVLMPVIK